MEQKKESPIARYQREWRDKPEPPADWSLDWRARCQRKHRERALKKQAGESTRRDQLSTWNAHHKDRE